MTSVPLLTTKFFISQHRPDIVPRPRLIEHLNDGLTHKLTLISAPAGFGKSTLLSAWVNQQDNNKIHHFRVAWLSLDERDNDLIRFLTYFVAALQTVESSFGQGILAALQSSGVVNTEIVLTLLINEIVELPKDVILILDDYHVIDSQSVNQAIIFLLDHLPSQMHLIVASRIDPNWHLSRLRARGQMTEIRADDLRFTLEEAHHFLNQVMGFDLSPQVIAALDARTEGWITGLQLAALSMRGRDDVQGFVRSFTGSNRYILDYLGEEVLSQQAQEIHDFLLQTSLLKRLTGPLCDAVTGNKDGEKTLESLDRENLFIIPLDNDRCWYRYHHLFADLLNRRLSQTFPEKVQGLHQRASTWHQNKGDIDDAVYHAQAANDTKQVVDILEDSWSTLSFRGELSKLRRWLDSLGPENTRKSAPLSLAYCWIHHQTDADEMLPKHLNDIRSVLKAGSEIESYLEPPRMAIIPSQVETMEANVALHRKQADKAKAHAKKSLSLIPEDLDPAYKGLLRGAANFRLALAHQELGEYEPACDLMLDVLEGLKAGKNYIGVSKTILQIVGIYQKLGKTQAAIKLCNDALRYITEHGWEKMPPCGIVNIILADLQAASGDFDAAKKNLDIGWKLVEPIRTPKIINMRQRVDEKLGNIMPSSQHLVEPLSPRECDVLQLIAQGLSNREISEKLFLALSTVKGHNRNIFEKLQVQRRTEAVARARELGVI